MAAGPFTLNDFKALTDQLAALVEAEVPIDVKLDESGGGPMRTRETVKAIVNRRVRHGESLPEALAGDEQDLPESYRRLMQLAVRTGDADVALAGSNRLAESAAESHYAARSAFLYPLVVCGLATVGLIAFCLFYVPTLENMYASLRVDPGRGLAILHFLRASLPYWVSALLIVILLGIAWSVRSRLRRANSTREPRWRYLLLPGHKQVVFQQRCANFADALAEVVVNGESLQDGLELAGEASGDAALRDAARELAAAIEDGRLPSDDGAIAQQFPPFLRWALWHSEETVGRERALRMAGQVYREAAERQFERARTVMPQVTLVMIGGGATLLYGLTLFVPVVELLRALASE